VSRPETHREVERKLRVHGLFRLPDLAAPGSGVARAEARPALRLTATYFDTSDLRLARSRITLRRREGGVDDGWHLKLPHDKEPATRDELRLPLDTPGDPPAALADLVLGITRGARLEPVATLSTDRRPIALLGADGRPLGELTDDTVSVLDGEHVAARFRELEVEAAPGGSIDDLGPVVATLLAAGALEGGYASKATRALGPAAEAPPDIPAAEVVQPRDPSGAAVRALLCRYVAAFVAQDLRVRRDLPDSVHQMRVAARRLRSGLKVFAPLVEAEWADALRTELGWIAGELGGVRDREVLEARMLGHLTELGDDADAALAARVVRRVLDTQMAAAGAEAAVALGSARYLTLLDSLVGAAREPRLTEAALEPCAQALPPLVVGAWQRLARSVRRLHPDGPDDEWHRTRIAAKRARYAVESVTPVFGDPARLLAKQLERVTEELGEHQDAVIAADTARAMAAGRGVSGRAGFALGLLHAAERANVRAARRRFEATWPDVSRPRWRRWLTQAR